ncbi:DUF4376 domain-containing protein [Citrobacter freundii]|nr:DUF4376 domain-containing protein [Citrobacter freundii]MBC6508283.1 DUF4376 domain-containing protein [Citrobacter freundii]
MIITALKNARYLQNGAIDCEIQPEGMDDFIPFTATQEDSSMLGAYVWKTLTQGDYGNIEPYVVTPDIINTVRQMKHDEISRWRDIQENDNIIFEFDGHRWDGGKASQERLAPVVAAAKAGMLPEGFFWTDADNHDIQVNVDFLLQLEAAMVQAMVIQGFKIHERQRQMKAEVAALQTPEEISEYSIGWDAF